jgi:hypothetical protein
LLSLQGFEENSLLMQGSCCKLATRAANAALMGYLAIKAQNLILHLFKRFTYFFIILWHLKNPIM